jgi:gas vesicle protein
MTGSIDRPLSGSDAVVAGVAPAAVGLLAADASSVTLGNRPAGCSPFGTQLTVAETMAATKQLEDLLLAQSQEKDELTMELAKMPLGAGRTLKERQRKMQVEQRLEELDKLISKNRMQLKKLLGK